MKKSQMDGFKIRDAKRSDVSTILELVKDLAHYEKLSHEVLATEALYEKNGFGKSPSFQTLLVENMEEREPDFAGFALYFFTFSTFVGKPTLYLEDLYVKPKFRGLGIGRALLKRLAEIALEKDCGRMEWAVLNWNEPAIRFYESIHAVPMKEWTVFRLRTPDIVHLANS